MRSIKNGVILLLILLISMPLTIKNKQQIFKGKFIKVMGTTFLDEEGKEHIWEWVEKKDAVFIFAITKDNKVVLIKNFRVPLEKYVIELPAGLMDKNGENTEDAIRRELLEETGYSVDKLYPMPPTPYAAGINNNKSFYYIATGAVRVSDAHGDVSEDITVIEIPAHELVNYYLNNSTELFNIGILAMCQVALNKGFIKEN